MIAKKISIFFLILASFSLIACSDVRIKDHQEWAEIFQKHNITEGGFEYYDNNKELASFYNKDRISERFSPANTFEIISSLIALESNIALDEQMKIKADSQLYYFNNGKLTTDDKTGGVAMQEWQQEMSLQQAFKSNNTAAFKEIAKRIGQKEMKTYIDSTQYGNMNMSGNIQDFWMNDTLKITPDEQVGLMKRLYHDQLPFSPRSQRIVKGMMLQEEADDYKLYYKIGHGFENGKNIIWVVGFAETVHRLKNPKSQIIEAIPHPYFFALNYSTGTKEIDSKTLSVNLLHDLLTKVRIHDYKVK